MTYFARRFSLIFVFLPILLLNLFAHLDLIYAVEATVALATMMIKI